MIVAGRHDGLAGFRNAYVVVLGNPETASSRLNLSAGV